MNSVDNNSSELHDLVTDVSNMANSNNASNNITYSSDVEIFDSFDFYLSGSDTALNFNSTIGFSDNTISTNSYQWNHHGDLTMFLNMDEMDKHFSSQNYADLNALYQSNQNTNINLNLDELNNQFVLRENAENVEIGQVLENTSDRLSLPIVITDENELRIDECFNDLIDLEDLSHMLEENNSVLKREENKRNTLVLDMDETLIHTVQTKCDDANFFINICNTQWSVMERPHLRYFLGEVAKMFEIVIFTAGQRAYASQILDKLDPYGILFSRRFYRDSCIDMEKGHVKDLTILGVDLARVAIIDNSPKVFRLQRANGIPIKSWYDDPSDVELLLMLNFLKKLAKAPDVRPLISERLNPFSQSSRYI